MDLTVRRTAKRTAAERAYEDFEPTLEWARTTVADTLIVYLPGFNKEQLKVQVTTARDLRLSGERPIDGEKWLRFRREIPIPSNYNINRISAKFEKGTLYVQHPKAEQPPPGATIPEPKRPTVERKSEPPAEAPPRRHDQPTEAKTPRQEKVQQPPEPSIPGPKRPKVERKLEPSAEAPPRPQAQSTEAKTPRQEKVEPPPEASIPGPERPTVQEKLEPSAEALPRPQDPFTEAKKPLQEQVQPPPEAAVAPKPPLEPAVAPKPPLEPAVAPKPPLEAAVAPKPPQEKGQPSREPSISRPEEKPSAEKLNGTTSQRTERDQPSPDSVLGAAENGMDSVEGAGKIESWSDIFKRERFRIDYIGWIMELKKPSKLISLVLGILLVVATVLYAMTALRSPSKSEN